MGEKYYQMLEQNNSKGKGCKINEDIKFIKLCKKEHLIPTFAKGKIAIKSGNVKRLQELA